MALNFFLQSLSYLQATPNASPTSIWFEILLNPFVLAIIVLFVIAFFRLAGYIRQVPGQREALDEVVENYREVERKQETDAELIKQGLLNNVDSDSLVAQRVFELHRISIRGGDFDQMALAEVLAAQESAKIGLARYVASVLVLLGLCGAIWGLSGLIRNMSPALDEVQAELDRNSPREPSTVKTAEAGGADNNNSAIQESFKKLINTMSLSLASTRGAFSASLTGILASIILLMLNWFVSSRQVNFLTALEGLTATKLIPIFKRPPEATQLAEVVTAFREGSTYMVRLSDELDSKVSQVGTSLENLFAIVRKFGEGAEAMRTHQAFVNQAQEQMMSVVNEFMGLTSRIEAYQAGSHGDLEGVVRAVEESNQRLTRTVEDWHVKHEDMLQAMERSARQSRVETKEARELAQKGIDELSGLLNTAVDHQMGRFRAEALELLEQQQAGTREHIDEMLRQQGVFVADLQQSISKSDGHQALISGLGATISEERSAFAISLNDMLKQNDRALKTIIGEQKKLLDISGLKSVEKQLEQFVQENRVGLGGLVERQGELDDRFNDLTQLAERLGNMLRILISIGAVTVPVFAALGIMYIFNIQPEDQVTRVVAFLAIVTMVVLLSLFLRSRS